MIYYLNNRIRSFSFNFVQFFSQFWHCLEKISLKAVIRYLENGFIRLYFSILFTGIDGNDNFWVLHASQVLHCSGKTHSDIEFRGDNFSSLADLQLVGAISRIDCCSGGSDGCIPKCIGEGINNGKVLFALHSPSTRNNDSRWCQIRLSRIGTVLFHEFCLGARGKRDFCDLRVSWCCWCFIEIRWAEGQKVDILCRFDFSQCVASVSGSYIGIFPLHYQ